MNNQFIGSSISLLFFILIWFIKTIICHYIDNREFNKQLKIIHEKHLKEKKEFNEKFFKFATAIIVTEVINRYKKAKEKNERI